MKNYKTLKNVESLTGNENSFSYHRICNLNSLVTVVETEEALQIANPIGKRLWIPKSQMKVLQAPFVNDLFISDFICKRHPEFFEKFYS